MKYKKFAATQLFTGTEILYNSVLITNENGVVQDITALSEAGEDVVHLNGILSPGFVNCHCHLELSHLRGRIHPGTGLVNFVTQIIAQRTDTENQILNAIAIAEQEMYDGGIVAVGDISNNAITAAQKAKHNLAYYNFVEVSGWLPAVAETRINTALEVFYKYNTLYNDVNAGAASIVPHAPYSVSGKLWGLLQPFFTGKTISIHNQETPFEDELFLQGTGDFVRMYELFKMTDSGFEPTGKTSLATYFTQLSGAKNVMLVHNTFTSEADVQYAKTCAAHAAQQLFFCLCVNANLYIENALPPVDMLLRNNCNIVLGTDSLASNYSLSILDEIQTLQQKFDFLTTAQLLQFATLNGAKALQMHEKLGSFAKDKQPGVLLIANDLSGVKRLL